MTRHTPSLQKSRTPCRLRINAVANDRRFVALKASGSDDRCRSYVKCLTLFAVIWASVRTVRGPG